VVATCYLLGVSTRRMDKMVRSLGITGLSKSQVSQMAKDLDDQVEAFRRRPLDAGPYTFVAADALVMKVREAGRVVKIAVLVVTGINAESGGASEVTSPTGPAAVRPRATRSRKKLSQPAAVSLVAVERASSP